MKRTILTFILILLGTFHVNIAFSKENTPNHDKCYYDRDNKKICYPDERIETSYQNLPGWGWLLND